MKNNISTNNTSMSQGKSSSTNFHSRVLKNDSNYSTYNRYKNKIQPNKLVKQVSKEMNLDFSDPPLAKSFRKPSVNVNSYSVKEMESTKESKTKIANRNFKEYVESNTRDHQLTNNEHGTNYSRQLTKTKTEVEEPKFLPKKQFFRVTTSKIPIGTKIKKTTPSSIEYIENLDNFSKNPMNLNKDEFAKTTFIDYGNRFNNEDPIIKNLKGTPRFTRDKFFVKREQAINNYPDCVNPRNYSLDFSQTMEKLKFLEKMKAVNSHNALIKKAADLLPTYVVNIKDQTRELMSNQVYQGTDVEKVISELSSTNRNEENTSIKKITSINIPKKLNFNKLNQNSNTNLNYKNNNIKNTYYYEEDNSYQKNLPEKFTRKTKILNLDDELERVKSSNYNCYERECNSFDDREVGMSPEKYNCYGNPVSNNRSKRENRSYEYNSNENYHERPQEKSPKTFQRFTSNRALGLYKQKQDLSNNDLVSERSNKSKYEFYGKNYQQFDIIKHVDYNPFDHYKKSSLNRNSSFSKNNYDLQQSKDLLLTHRY